MACSADELHIDYLEGKNAERRDDSWQMIQCPECHEHLIWVQPVKP